MLTQEDISGRTEEALTLTQAGLLLQFIRFCPAYDPGTYPGLEDKLFAFVEPTSPDPLTARDIYSLRALLAILDKLGLLGSATLKIRNASGVSMDLDKERDRNELARFALLVLYDKPAKTGLTQIGVRSAAYPTGTDIPNQNTEGGWPSWQGNDWWYYSLPRV